MVWTYNDITVPEDLPVVDALQQVLGAQDVQNLLMRRQIVGDSEVEPKVHALVEQHAREVAANVGEASQPGVFGLAVWATILGSASATESSVFPEQQDRDGQAEYWYRRYQGALVRLREASGLGGGPAGSAVAEAFSGTVSIRGRR